MKVPAITKSPVVLKNLPESINKQHENFEKIAKENKLLALSISRQKDSKYLPHSDIYSVYASKSAKRTPYLTGFDLFITSKKEPEINILEKIQESIQKATINVNKKLSQEKVMQEESSKPKGSKQIISVLKKFINLLKKK